MNYKIFILGSLIFIAAFTSYFILLKKRLKIWGGLAHSNTANLQSLVKSGTEGIKDIIIYNLQNYFYTGYKLELSTDVSFSATTLPL